MFGLGLLVVDFPVDFRFESDPWPIDLKSQAYLLKTFERNWTGLLGIHLLNQCG